ncbi:hypothetical protein AVEN_82495-1 [Araneus ventricosus]|uniref:Uncharacterized protein n=1 Tax=Araneus ventricosus TaxID=182803 RepID=A0A4Y2Q464_ARAVE|nr:hypothetical protein AVEN_82495-1 [Araneus ventricosus]
MESKRTQNPRLHEPIPIRDTYARLAAHQRICLDWDLATRVENRKSAEWGDRRATVAHFGAYVNDVRNSSIKMGGERTGLRQMAYLQVEPSL